MNSRRRRTSTPKVTPVGPESVRGTRRFLRTDESAASDTEPALRQPDERDESADQQTTTPRAVIKQAHDDQNRQQDTDCRNRIPEVLPDEPKTPQNFDQRDKLDPAPRAGKKTSE